MSKIFVISCNSQNILRHFNMKVGLAW